MQEMETEASDGAPRLPFFASCPKGFERLLADELRGLNIPRPRPLHGQVAFSGTLEDAYRICLWSRLASRVVLVLKRVDAPDSDALYEGVSSIAWEEHVPRASSVAIDAHGANARLKDTRFTALRAKDAIVDRLMSIRGARPLVSIADPDLRIVARISAERATLGIDLSGEPLFRRGRREDPSSQSGRKGGVTGLSPLRADYAAALLAAGGWNRRLEQGEASVVSVFPGAGVLLAEAAQQALDRAPALLRTRWGFEGWAGHDRSLWEGLLGEARDRADVAGKELAEGDHTVELVGCDSRPASEPETRQLLRSMGMDLEPRFWRPGTPGAGVAEVSPLIVYDLSWIRGGEDVREAAALAFSSSTMEGLRDTDPASIVSLTHDPILDRALGLSVRSVIDVLIGQSAASIRTYDTSSDGRGEARLSRVRVFGHGGGTPKLVPTLVEGSEQFCHRLSKVAKARVRWARREDVSCYRVYDADLPDYAVTLDLFEGSTRIPTHRGCGRWLQVYEYAAPRDVDPIVARMRLLDVLSIAPAVLGVEPDNVFVRVRTRSRGGSQSASESRAGGATGTYGNRAGRGRSDRAPRPSRLRLPKGAQLVDEGGLTFEVNFQSRLDCGIFLDHRDTRSMIREMAKKTKGSKRFLNLFAYTGTASCYAADGGCKHTTSVDLSRPSLDWARRNMRQNGFTGLEHEYVQADVTQWVGEQRRTKNRWDLIFCDVPTFSNSKGMRGSWDVQRDHAELLIGVSRLLTRAGVALFSCNLRTFRPDVGKLGRAGVTIEDITPQTIPEDFSRSPKIHHCYLVRRTPEA